MTTAQPFAAYRDVRIILDTAMATNKWPVEYALNTAGEAISWRLRANRLRSEIRKYDKKLDPGKPLGQSPYDELVFTLDDNKVIIDMRMPTGVLTHAGQPIAPLADVEAEDDEDDFELGDL